MVKIVYLKSNRNIQMNRNPLIYIYTYNQIEDFLLKNVDKDLKIADWNVSYLSHHFELKLAYYKLKPSLWSPKT